VTVRTRLLIGTVVGVIAALLLVFGLINPLEGGIALLAATLVLVVVRLVSRVPVPKLAWISVTVAIALGVTVLSIVIFWNPPQTTDGKVPNPFNPAVIGLLWAYRLAVLVAIAGAVQYVVRLIRAVRATRKSVDSGRA
jgi:hypothetical protein